MGYDVIEGKLAIADIMQAAREGKLEEVFGTGTAAVVSPVKELVWKGEHAYIGDGKIGPVTQKLYDTMTGMQWGKILIPRAGSFRLRRSIDPSRASLCSEFLQTPLGGNTAGRRLPYHGFCLPIAFPSAQC